NYASTHNNHKLGWRLLSALLIVCVLLPMMGRSAMYGQSDDPQDNAPLNVPFGPTLFIIETTGQAQPADLPPTTVIHTRLEEPGRFYWIASGATEDANLLAATGLAVTTIDADTAGAIYYIADGAAFNAATLATSVGEVIWQQAPYLMVATDADHELALVETLPVQGVAISLLAPLPLAVEEAPVAPAALPAAAAVVDPVITALLSQITPQELQVLVNQLSGQTPAPVGGAAVTISTRYTFASSLRSAEQFVYEYYQALGLNVRYAPWTYGKYSGRNVVAEVRGSTQPERVLLVGGHLDDTSNIPYTTAPGADDNATGTAATMVLARLLANYQPTMTVRFVHFTGEEQGQWGSKIYAGALRQAGEQVVGFFNLDMIGWDGNNDRVVEIHTGSGPKSNALADQYLERNDRYGGGLVFERKSTTASRFSDHSPFWDSNFASFLVIENFFVDARPNDRNPYYHNTGDLASRVNFDYVARIARVTLATLAELAGYDLTGAPATATPTATPTQTAT
ncbi:MAG: M28 family peptidase, partial [Caldilinea sp.]